jgi:hypothetical protein
VAVIRAAHGTPLPGQPLAKSVSRVDIAKSQKRLFDEQARAKAAQRLPPPVTRGPDWQAMIEAESLLSGRKQCEPERYNFSTSQEHNQSQKMQSDGGNHGFPDATDEEVKGLVLETIKARRKVADPAERLHVALYEPASIGDYSRFNHEDVPRPRMRNRPARLLGTKPTAMDRTLIGQRFKAFLAAHGASPGKAGK